MKADYVIVGAGTAGCVLAARLSEDPDVRVVLLEAGGPDSRPEIHIPAAFSKLFKTDADWAYFTTPQEGAAGRRLFWPRGRVLGGSSAINAMIYIRGHRADFDGWAADGCEGWGYADVLPYFRKSEDNARGADAYHGVDGPVRVEDPRSPSPLSLAFVEAAREAGHTRTPDFNGPDQEGAGLYQITQRRGRRVSAATAFLKPAMRRPNLTVETGAHVLRVVFEGTRAVGVEYVQDGVAQVARAGREVLLAGGAVNSPQLLMLSGVGDAEQLRAHGVEVVADRPAVGDNLQDHLIVGLRRRLRSGASLKSAETPLSVLRYLVFRNGMLSSNVAEAGLFAHTSPGAAPDVQFHVAPGFFDNHGLDPIPFDALSIGPTLVGTKSRGRITLASADPFEHPHIDPNALGEASDVEVLVRSLEMAREIAAQPALAGLLAEEHSPGASVTTREGLARYVRETCETLYHPVGTCRMGADADAVVDLDLRVNGVDGLRVIDASVMPTIPNGNTNAPTTMIAERAADLLRGVPRRVAAALAGDGVSAPGVLSATT